MRHRSNAAIGGRKQRGLSLIELSIALAIAAAVLFGLFYIVNTANAKRITTADSQALVMMANDLRTKFSGQGNFTGLTNATLIALGIPPEPMMQGGNNLTTGFSTPITVASTNVNGIANDGFQITYSDYPSKSCSDFVMAAAHNFARVTIGGTVIKDLGTGSTDGEITVAELALCQGSDGVVGSITFAQGR